ncbi:MAG: FG-GAP-like repeat-containing protein [Piscinibacter sp.]
MARRPRRRLNTLSQVGGQRTIAPPMAACAPDREQSNMRMANGWGQWWIVWTLASLLAGCGGGGGGGGGGTGLPDGLVFSAAGKFFPSDADARWVYSNGENGEITTQTVVGTQAVDGGTAKVVQGVSLLDGSRTSSVYLTDADGVREYLPNANDPVSAALSGVHVIRWPAAAGDSFSLLDQTINSGVDYDGDNRPDRIALRVDLSIIGSETLTTPAGRFENCAHQQQTLQQTLLPSSGQAAVTIRATIDSWFAPGVGLVRSTVAIQGGTQSTRETQTLTGYRVGTRTSDAQAPAVRQVTPATSPSRGSITTVSAVFDEAVDPATVLGKDLRIRDAQGNVVGGSVQVQGNTVRFVPTQDWASGSYQAELSATVSDLLGNALGAARRWQFTVDADAPGLASSTPASDAVDVPLDSSIVMHFTEPPDPTTITAETIVLSRLTDAMRLPVTLSVSGTTVTLRPAAPLQRGITYAVTLLGVADALGNNTGTAYQWYFRTVQGLFAYPQPLIENSFAGGTAIGDVNGDSINDLLLAAQAASGESRLYLRRGRADGSLADPVAVALDAQLTCMPQSVAIGDLNGDGRNDIVAGASYCGAQILYQGADGSLQPGPLLSMAATGYLRIADIDGDGRLDLLSSGGGQPGVLYWRQDTNGSLEAPRTVATVDPPGDFAVGDINGDGRADIVATTGGAPGADVAVITQLLDGSFASPTTLSIGSSSRASSVTLGDLNGDGRLDIAVSSGGNSNAQIAVFLQRADGTLSTLTRLATYDIPGAVRVADVDGNGRADLLVVHQGWLTVGVYLQDGAGALSAEQRFAAPYSVSTPDGWAVGDVNNDGRLDIVIDGHWLRQLPPDAVPALAARPVAHGFRGRDRLPFALPSR